jgi:hypothetical protein
MSAVFASSQLTFARTNLDILLKEYEPVGLKFCNQAWYKELVRLNKDAIRECGVGRHGLGKYAINKLRDTAKHWSKAAEDVELEIFGH